MRLRAWLLGLYCSACPSVWRLAFGMLWRVAEWLRWVEGREGRHAAKRPGAGVCVECREARSCCLEAVDIGR